MKYMLRKIIALPIQRVSNNFTVQGVSSIGR